MAFMKDGIRKIRTNLNTVFVFELSTNWNIIPRRMKKLSSF